MLKLKIPLHIYHSPFPLYWLPKQPTTAENETDLQVVLSMYVAGQLDVFRHYGYTLCMYSTQVGILQEASQVVLSGLLQHLDHVHLEAQIMLPISLCYLMDQACKGLLMVAWYSSGTGVSQGEPLCLAGTCGEALIPL